MTPAKQANHMAMGVLHWESDWCGCVRKAIMVARIARPAPAIWSYKGNGSENTKWLMGQGFNLCALYHFSAHTLENSFKHLSVLYASIKLGWISLLKRQEDQEPRKCLEKSQNTVFKELFYGENVLPCNCFPSSLQCIAISKWAVLLMRPQLPKSTFRSWK